MPNRTTSWTGRLNNVENSINTFPYNATDIIANTYKNTLNTKIIATVINIEKPKKFNKNAKVYLRYDCIILPNCDGLSINAKTCTKDGTLKEGPWMTAGKLAASTVGLGAIGAGAGVGFAFIPDPAKIGTGLAIGIPVGASVGLVAGLLTPGLKYHAKAGEKIRIVLCDELSLPILEQRKNIYTN